LSWKVLEGACHGKIYGRMSSHIAFVCWALGLLGLVSSIISIFELVIAHSTGAELRKWTQLEQGNSNTATDTIIQAYQTELTSTRME